MLFRSVQDFGAGSVHGSLKQRRICDIARNSLKPAKQSALLYRIAKHYKCKHILELGTSLGITSSYLAHAGADELVSFEGASEIVCKAKSNFEKQNLKNILVVEGNMDETLPAYQGNATGIDMAFIDGNHRKDPTLEYFRLLLERSNADAV